jgi:hypothetical protein
VTGDVADLRLFAQGGEVLGVHPHADDDEMQALLAE